MAKNIVYALLATIILASYTSCCTKQDCDQKLVPQVIFQYEDENLGLNAPIVYIVGKEDFQKKDSFELLKTNKIYFFSELDLIHHPDATLRDFTFVIKSPNSWDTIFDITYQNIKRRVDCNSCFLGDGSETVEDFKDFSYQHKGNTYYKEDTLILRKQ